MALSDMLKEQLPNLAQSLSGPAKDVVESAIASRLGVPASDLETHVQNNPTCISNLSDFDSQIKSLLDLSSARSREVEAMQNGNTLTKLTTPILSLTTILLTFVICASMIFFKIPSEQNQIAIYVLGFLTSSATQIFSYYFGSSQGQDTQRMVGMIKPKT